MKAKVYNLEGNETGDIDLKDEIFARPWNPDLVHQALLTQVSNRRKPVAYVKTRSEVRGGGKKPWRQKGTGRARHGSIRSPIWKGGGVTHGPIAERNFSKKINKKMKKAALYSVISKKLSDNQLKIVDSLKIDSGKSRELDSALKKFLNKPKSYKKLSALLIPTESDKSLFRASSNIPKVKSLRATSLNVEDLLKYKNVLIDKKTVAEIK